MQLALTQTKQNKTEKNQTGQERTLTLKIVLHNCVWTFLKTPGPHLIAFHVLIMSADHLFLECIFLVYVSWESIVIALIFNVLIMKKFNSFCFHKQAYILSM